uniref:Tyrosine decarboxylase n=1 Tax=Oryza glaberrima TaxID=4538 RepID=I1QKR5_ORYGL
MAILNHSDAAFPVAATTPLLGRRPLDAGEFRRQGRQVVDFIADYYASINDYPVRPAVAPGFLAGKLPATAPSTPEPDALTAGLRDVRELMLPGVTHWQSPRHFAHFSATASNVGALGEALAAGLNVNPFTWEASPAATELEVVVTDWLGKALHLPERLLFAGGGGGTLLGTSCEAMLCTIVAARDEKLAEIGEERIGDLVVYCSDQTHFSFQKAARIAGIRRGNCREIPTCRESGFVLTATALQAAVAADEAAGRVPLFLCATVGTTPTAAVDPLRELCAAVEGRRVRVPGVPPRHRRRRGRGLVQHEPAQVAPRQHGLLRAVGGAAGGARRRARHRRRRDPQGRGHGGEAREGRPPPPRRGGLQGLAGRAEPPVPRAEAMARPPLPRRRRPARRRALPRPHGGRARAHGARRRAVRGARPEAVRAGLLPAARRRRRRTARRRRRAHGQQRTQQEAPRGGERDGASVHELRRGGRHVRAALRRRQLAHRGAARPGGVERRAGAGRRRLGHRRRRR